MAGELPFRTDLYRGTVPFYDHYRPPYPAELLDDLCQRLPVSGNGRLLDLACGGADVLIMAGARRMAKLGATDRVPVGWEAAMDQDPHEQVLRQAGFQYVGRFEFSVGQYGS